MRDGMPRTSTSIALLLLAWPLRLSAQAADTPPVDERPVAKAAADTGKFAIITRRDLWYAGGFLAATVGVSQFDVRVAQNLQDTSRIPSALKTRTARTFNTIGIPGAILAPAGAYIVGRLSGTQSLADAGLHTMEAVLLTEAATYLAKFAFGRERPYYAGTDDSDDFHFGGGLKGNDFSSFPSGHSSAAFAMASAMTAEISSRRPKAALIAGPLLYGSAALVGWARLQSNKHWLSDVFMGAGLGTLIGIKTVRFNHKHPHNKIDRFFLAATPALVPDGRGSVSLAVVWSFSPRFLTGR
jgi:membrane-associated phospholipid phosphatase